MLDGVELTLMVGPVAATAAPASVMQALQSVEVSHNSGQRSGFQLQFAISPESPLLRDLLPSGYFDPMTRVILVVTMNGAPTVLMDGVVTQHDVAASGTAGQSTLTVTGLDVSYVMDLIDLSGIPMPALPPSARVLLLVARYAAFGIIPKVIPSVVLAIDNPLQHIPGQQGTDYAYINKLAQDVGYVFYIEPGPFAGTNTAYWGPEIRVGVPQAPISVGVDGESNVDSLSFSFDGVSKTIYYLMHQIPETKTNIPIPIPDITPLNPPLGRKMPIPLSAKPLNRETMQSDGSTAKLPVAKVVARGLAQAARNADVITGSGTLDVMRYGRILQARRLVGVRGSGPSYDGEYFVSGVTSNLKPGSFTQSFRLTRNAHVSLAGKVLT